MLKQARHQRSQAMPEFALVAPILFLIIFGIFDLGRGILDYVAIQTAANETARVVVQGEPDLSSSGPYEPPTSSVAASAASLDTKIVSLHNGGTVAGTCLNGPISSSWAGTNTGVIFITDTETVPTPAGQGAPANGYNGTPSDPAAPAGCWTLTAAQNRQPLQVTVVYHFEPFTWKLLQIGQHITLTAWSVYETEY